MTEGQGSRKGKSKDALRGSACLVSWDHLPRAHPPLQLSLITVCTGRERRKNSPDSFHPPRSQMFSPQVLTPLHFGLCGVGAQRPRCLMHQRRCLRAGAETRTGERSRHCWVVPAPCELRRKTSVISATAGMGQAALSPLHMQQGLTEQFAWSCGR